MKEPQICETGQTMNEPRPGQRITIRTGSGTADVEVVGVFPAPAADFERQVAFKVTRLDEEYAGVFKVGLGLMWPLSLFVAATN